MEDWNMIAADCVVISCCCQCLVLQLVLFVLLKLPYKLIRKMKQYVKKKLGSPKRERTGYYIDGGHSGSFRIEGFCLEEWRGYGNCMEEVEKELEDMSRKGEFAFGSFWGGEDFKMPRLDHPHNFNTHGTIVCLHCEYVNMGFRSEKGIYRDS